MSAEQIIKVLGICGSLRQKSTNLAALKHMGELMSAAGMKLEILSIADIPLYNQDIHDRGFPEPVLRLRRAIKDCDGLYLASPEYNFSVTGPLKNAIDWASRAPEQPFMYKPVAMLSVTEGPVGGVRNQYDLRKILVQLHALVLPRPEVFIGNNLTRFDADGRVNDAATVKVMTMQAAAFKDWIVRMKRAFAPN